MRLHELLETLTKPNCRVPFVILKAKCYDEYGESTYFTYKGAVVYATELLNLPQAILDKPVLSVKEEKRQFGLREDNTIVPVDYTIEIAF